MSIKEYDRRRLKKVRRDLAKAYEELVRWQGQWPLELREAEGMIFAAGVRLDYIYAGRPKFERR